MTPQIASRIFRSLVLRQLVWAFCLGLVVLFIAALVNVIGIRVAGDVNGWARWLTAHREYFLAWRLALYAATGCGWWWMRTRVIQREPNARLGLQRAEIAAIVVIFALELSALLHP